MKRLKSLEAMAKAWRRSADKTHVLFMDMMEASSKGMYVVGSRAKGKGARKK